MACCALWVRPGATPLMLEMLPDGDRGGRDPGGGGAAVAAGRRLVAVGAARAGAVRHAGQGGRAGRGAGAGAGVGAGGPAAAGRAGGQAGRARRGARRRRRGRAGRRRRGARLRLRGRRRRGRLRGGRRGRGRPATGRRGRAERLGAGADPGARAPVARMSERALGQRGLGPGEPGAAGRCQQRQGGHGHRDGDASAVADGSGCGCPSYVLLTVAAARLVETAQNALEPVHRAHDGERVAALLFDLAHAPGRSAPGRRRRSPARRRAGRPR